MMASNVPSKTSVPSGDSQAQGQQQNRTQFLVVCGVRNVEDAWSFGDFVGVFRAIEAFGGQGTYYNTFPIEEYFQRNPTTQNIKFGRIGIGPAPWQPLDVYTKWEFQHRQRFWQQFHTSPNTGGNIGGRPGSIKEAVQLYIDNTARYLTSGDIFNVVLLGHGGNATGSIQLGRDTLHSGDLAKSLDHFAKGVRLNLIVQACESGTFVDTIRARNQHHYYVHSSTTADKASDPDENSPRGRFRNSVFTGAWIKSLKLARDPATSKPWCLEDHIRYVANVGGPPRASPQSWTNIDLLTRFTDVLFADYVAFSFDQTGNTARRVITPPNPAQPTTSSRPAEGLPWDSLQKAREVIDKEMSLIDRYPPELGDMRFDSVYEECCRFEVSVRGGWNSNNTRIYSRMVRQIAEGLRW